MFVIIAVLAIIILKTNFAKRSHQLIFLALYSAIAITKTTEAFSEFFSKTAYLHKHYGFEDISMITDVHSIMTGLFVVVVCFTTVMAVVSMFALKQIEVAKKISFLLAVNLFISVIGVVFVAFSTMSIYVDYSSLSMPVFCCAFGVNLIPILVVKIIHK